ncbi:MAG: ATP-binding cassette domain-containing protein [Bacteroidetes bacterium]|uniref:ATP-binding cassette domain-containing protein n=1 Tax=Candidatus Egerieousia excrementavium TaxID=2840778 RepID=A0A9D9DKP3_9BACT|nr:ATP-binding cassette domain-containing protein [Candidatus Egerieousia excrementavium]
MELIKCLNITKKFGNYTALNSVSIDIPQGKIFGLLGPNGAGKTTLIRILNRITMPDSGEIIFNGRSMEPLDVEQIGYLPEERGLYKKMKVGEQAVYLARLKGLSRSDAVRLLKEWFIKFGIEEWWNKKVEELSKGMAQKVQFIITVLHHPRLLILDEPFSGFDPVNVSLIRSEILRLRDEGTTILLSTHNMESVEELCDNIALINKSNLIVHGNVEQIRRKYGNNHVELVYKADSPLQALFDEKALPFSIVSDKPEGDESRIAVLDVRQVENNSQVLRLLVNAIEVVSFRELIPRMEDIFIKLVTNNNQ